MMKKTATLLIIAALLFSLQACLVSQKPSVDFFNTSAENFSGARFTSINVPMFLTKPIVKRALQANGDDEEVLHLFRKISDIKVMTVENAAQQMKTNFAQYLKRNNFEDWVTIKKDQETINFQARQKGEQIRNLLITITSEEEMVLVDVSGKFSAEDISRIINYSEKNDVKKILGK